MAELRKSSATQKNRGIAVNTVLGEDVLLLQHMTGRESLGRLFDLHLDLLSTDADIELDEVLGTNATVRYQQPKGGVRYFNGIVSDFRYVGERGNYAAYEMVLRPWLWFLTRTSDCRIFQNKKVPDIITDLFREHGFTDYENALTGDYREREYCVQYRETTFNFVSRLMEQEGIYYFVKHRDGSHLIVLADDYSAHDIYPDYSVIPCMPSDRPVHTEHISHFDIKKQVLPGVVALNDFDFKKPKADLKANVPKARSHAKADYEVYDYPGEFEERSDGEAYARKRIEELHSLYEVGTGRGNAAGLAVGYLFNLTDHPRQQQNREHLITDASYEMRSEEYETGGGSVGSGEQHFLVDFSTIHSQEPFRPQRITHKPTVNGPQTAIVVGKAGEEIWTDEYGRVKVQFHWDRYGKRDENSSCWVRVSHPWAGKNWGAISIPRIGQEVIVDFLEGDPDRPIITGRVYNADVMPPFGLPGGAVVSGIKSDTHKGSGYNEISMDDTAGNERINIHAQYDMATSVGNNDTQHVTLDRTVTVDGKQSSTIKKNLETTVTEGNHSTVVESGHVYVQAAETLTLKVGNSTLTMDKDGNIFVDGAYIRLVGPGRIDLNP